MNLTSIKSTVFLSLLILSGQAYAERGVVSVQVQVAPSKPWTNYPTRTLAALPDSVTSKVDSGLDQYGGLLANKEKATGFFYPKKIDDRWWLIDPEGGRFIHKAVVAVSQNAGTNARAALMKKFGSESNWVASTVDQLHDNGFNGLGAWTDTARFAKPQNRLAYTLIWNFMSSYGAKRGGTYQQSGHIGYPKDCIFVFDPEFETFCDNYAKQLARYKDDPWLLGHFSDNEMPYSRKAIFNYLELPAKDPGHQAALAWLKERHGEQATIKDITEQDKMDFIALVTERYHRIVAKAIKKYDPNHILLGGRFNAAELHYPEVFKAAGPYLDVIAVNYYRMWTPSQKQVAMWSQESGRPILITEWYTKAVDSGLPNNSGAGWIVKTQKDRGLFYQNFTLGLLETKVCVGWHWFKYIDNDPLEPGTEPSNRDSNKGIVTSRYEPYTALLNEMKPLNDRVYSIAEFFDGAAR